LYYLLIKDYEFRIYKKNYHITTFILLYFSIILGFIFDENTTLGPKFDFFNVLKLLAFFEESFKFTFGGASSLNNLNHKSLEGFV